MKLVLANHQRRFPRGEPGLRIEIMRLGLDWGYSPLARRTHAVHEVPRDIVDLSTNCTQKTVDFSQASPDQLCDAYMLGLGLDTRQKRKTSQGETSVR